MHSIIVQINVHMTTTILFITLNPNQIIITHTDDVDVNHISHSVNNIITIPQNKRIFLPDGEGQKEAVQHLRAP